MGAVSEETTLATTVLKVVSLSTDTSESPAPGSRLQESGGKDDDLSWWSWVKKRRRGREKEKGQSTLEGLRMADAEFARDGPLVVSSEVLFSI